MKAFKADLALAGIEYGDRASGYADFHGLRKTLSTMLAAAGLSAGATSPPTAYRPATYGRHLRGRETSTRRGRVAAGSADSRRRRTRRARDSDARHRDRRFLCTKYARNSRHSQASRGTGRQDDRSRRGQGYGAHAQTLTSTGFGTQGHGAARGGNCGSAKAGEGARTLDIHVGNVRAVGSNPRNTKELRRGRSHLALLLAGGRRGGRTWDGLPAP